MPYAPDHKIKTRAKIIDVAKSLFNRRGFNEVSIDEIMSQAGLTRGGFYHHFCSKEELFAAAVDSFACDNVNDNMKAFVAQGLDAKEMAAKLISKYLSEPHLQDIEQQCPMVALPSDIARAGKDVRRAYEKLAGRMMSVFQGSLADQPKHIQRDGSYVLAALCVGGMVLARTFDDESVSEEILTAVREFGTQLIDSQGEAAQDFSQQKLEVA